MKDCSMDLVSYDGSLFTLIRKASELRGLELRYAPVFHSVIPFHELYYCIVLYSPVLHCSTLPSGINPFAVNNNNNNNNNNRTLK